MDLKLCTKCQHEKIKTEFYRSSRSKDGYNRQCKVCVNRYKQQKRQEQLTQLQKDIDEWYEPEF